MRIFVLQGNEVTPYEHPLSTLMTACFGVPTPTGAVPHATWFMAVVGFELVGTAAVDREERRLWNMCVAPRWRRQGVGRGIVRVATHLFPDLSLYVEQGNRGARRLYTHLNFKEVWRSDAQNMDLIEMEHVVAVRPAEPTPTPTATQKNM